jgi:tRNA1(Val) A37 N6-methylase TrmN6
LGFSDDELTCDRFLNGKLNIWQPRKGYRAGIDPVLLAASVDAIAGQTILELGCGSGVAALCVERRVSDLEILGVELQEEYADLARRNAIENGSDMEVVTSDLAYLPGSVRQRSFDHVIANPPYYRRENRTSALDERRETALAGATPLSVWTDVATRRLKPGGSLTVIQKSDRLQDLLTALDGRLGSILIKPIAPRAGKPAKLVILRAKKGGRGAFRLLAPAILHEGERHVKDGESYRSEFAAILRHGAPLEIA